MMDESSLEPTHFIDEKHSIENSHVVETIPFEKKVKKLDPAFFYGPDSDIKPDIMARVMKDLSRFEERHAQFTLPSPLQFKPFIRKKVRQEEIVLPSPLQFKPFIRKKVRQEEIVFNRECKKLEKVWTNRGLPVDKETVCSAACKDAFDLKDLSESLPSTSTSVNKPSIIEIETGCQVTPSMGIDRDEYHRRLANMKRRLPPTKMFYRSFYPRSFAYGRESTFTRLPVSETIPSACNSQMETVQKAELIALVRAQTWIRIKKWAQAHKKNFCPLLFSEKPDCDVKEASEESLLSKIEKASQELSQNPCISTSEQPNFGSEFAKMSIDDKQDEKKKETQDSGDENYLPSPVSNPFPPLLTNYVPKLQLPSSWDPNKNWNTKFVTMCQKFDQISQENSDLPAPFNSPIKKEKIADKSKLFGDDEKALANLVLNRLRENSKLKALDCYRRSRQIFCGDEDNSESEKPSLGESSRESSARTVFCRRVPKMDSCTQTERIRLDKLRGHIQLIRESRESLKNVRSFHCPFSRRHIVKSDKVVPD